MKIWVAEFWKDKTSDGTRFRAGITLIILSFPVSFASTIVGTLISAASDAWVGLAAGLAVYAFSWVLFVMGIWLAKRKGLHMAKELWRIVRHGRQKQ